MDYKKLFESAVYVLPVQAETDYKKYMSHCYKNCDKLINDYVNSGAIYDQNLKWNESNGSYWFYVDEENNHLQRISIFDENFKNVYSSHKRMSSGDCNSDFSLTVDEWQKLLSEHYLWDKFYKIFSVYDLARMMPERKWHIGNINFYGNRVNADVQKIVKLHKYLFKDNPDFAARNDLQIEMNEPRKTGCEEVIVISDDKKSTNLRVLLVNGNNGSTVYSEESLLPVFKFCKFVETELGGSAYIYDVHSHSDVYYYEIEVYV